MTSDTDARAALAAHSVIGAEPKGGYYLGRIHPHRLRTQSLQVQARVLLKAIVRQDRPRKILIFARPRSGTTLLSHLLNQVPGMRCDGELLHDIVAAPHLYLRILARRAASDAYGVKMLSYQMLEVQRVRDPLGFCTTLAQDGWHFVHVRRNTANQTMSLLAAQETGRYFNGSGGMDASRSVALPEDAYLDQVKWNAGMLDFEDKLMGHLPHTRIDYETDLADPARHQPTVDRVFEAIGHPTGPVTARMVRTGGRNGTVTIVNRDALDARLAGSDQAHLLDRAS